MAATITKPGIAVSWAADAAASDRRACAGQQAALRSDAEVAGDRRSTADSTTQRTRPQCPLLCFRDSSTAPSDQTFKETRPGSFLEGRQSVDNCLKQPVWCCRSVEEDTPHGTSTDLARATKSTAKIPARPAHCLQGNFPPAVRCDGYSLQNIANSCRRVATYSLTSQDTQMSHGCSHFPCLTG